MNITQRLLLAAAVLAVPSACGSTGPAFPDSYQDTAPRVGGHVGAAVGAGESGPARFVEPLLELFEPRAAMGITQYADGFYRAPASAGYDATVDRVLAELYGAGFGGDEGYDLEILTAAMDEPAWTPVAASIFAVPSQEALTASKAERERMRRRAAGRKALMLGFRTEAAPERAMLPHGASSCDVTGACVFRVKDVTPGTILVTPKRIDAVERAAAQKGAIAVVSYYLHPYCVDPTGKDRHFDAIHVGSMPKRATLPCFYVSPRVADVMEVASKVGTSYQLTASVATEEKELRTVVATIRGSELPDEVVDVVAKLDGAGANDNAAGVGGMVELARAMKRLIATGRMPRPRRSLRFVFGTEERAGSEALGAGGGQVIAAIAADMIGASYAKTGAVCLLERGWDPATIVTLPPDSHTTLGAGEAKAEQIIPNGLSIVMRQAMIDVGLATRDGSLPSWSTREHPWKGGGAQDEYLGRGIAAAHVWHFTDFAYQTSLDRFDHVDSTELRQTAVAIGAGALAVADGRPADLERYLASLNLERRMRLAASANSDDAAALEAMWRSWFDGARFWLKAVTAGEALPATPPLTPLEEFVPAD